VPANHFSASLSELDMAVVRSVPPGGNWKNVPESIPCKRIQTIRESFARGEGSRSTYYGRLRPDAPSYTINTYFSRPGNGCHIHYGQDRVISQREAARFQSFPDDFVFKGSRSAINVQIGNAVPPLLGYQLALTLGEPGVFAETFAGAGGLSLGFMWAGWKPLVATDIDARCGETYTANLHDEFVVGDIRDSVVSDEFVRRTVEKRKSSGDCQFLVLGGPPCQGFSTAGKRRSMSDERNALFENYREIVDRIEPDGFVFENVTGLLNMEKGRVFQQVCSVLGEHMNDMRAHLLRAEQYGVPQRRSRVVVIGRRAATVPDAPPAVTAFPADDAGISKAPGATDAIGDLPALTPGQDGSELGMDLATTRYQELMRGDLPPDEYLAPLEAAEAAMKQLELEAAA